MKRKIRSTKITFHIAELLLLCNFLKICSGEQYHLTNYGYGSHELFTCNNGKRIKSIFKCDTDNDCGDNYDEINCNYYYKKSCSKNDFQCTSKNCISRNKFCDGYFDCTDNSDEYDGCEKDSKCEGQFQCTNGYCLPKEWVCDGMEDCLDGSDELNCIAIGCKIENHRYQCTNYKCISLDLVCDDINDCDDSSDESITCNSTISCSSVGCSHNCTFTPKGPVCTCPQGYTLQNNDTCIDIDECAFYGICDQQCVNTKGSYKCICQAGYTLQDDMRTCKADGDEAIIIFPVHKTIHGVYQNSEIKFKLADDLNQVVNQIAVDDKYIYWSTEDKKIMKGTIDGKKEVILTTGLHKLSDIAVDWITGNIYFTDEDNMSIGVCDNNGTFCTILINGKTKQPTAIALLLNNGIMYWCNWHKPYIAMAGMDGNDITLFVTKRLKHPKSLTIDYPNNQLYWMDIGLRTIESIQLDGTNRKIILREISSRSVSLAIFENKIYWNEYGPNDCWRILYRNVFYRLTPKNLNENCNRYQIDDIQIYHPIMKSKVQNACFLNPCSQLCLLNKNKNYTCACTLDKKLNSDGHTCQDTEDGQHIIIVADGTFVDYYHNLIGKPKLTSSVTLRHITAITYDSLSGTILASNALTDSIFRYNPISGEIKNLIFMKIESLGGMAFDYIGNNLYLTNINEKTIEVHSLTTKAKKIFYFEEQPYNIELASEEGIMFVVFKVKNKYRIDKMQMDGTGMKSLFVESNLLSGPKISMYYHTDEKKIYWSDQDTHSIRRASLTGFDYQSFRINLNEPISLAIAREYVFWTQRNSSKLYWTNKNDIQQNIQDKDFSNYINKEIEISHLIVPQKKDNYRKNCGNCSHVCLPSSANSYLCACPPQMTLNADNHTCILQYTCSSGEIKCSEHDICIKWNQWCNGIKECPNGEDEPSHCKENVPNHNLQLRLGGNEEYIF